MAELGVLNSRPGPTVSVRALAPHIEALLEAGERSVKSLLASCQVRYVDADEVRAVDPELRSFRNLNTRADYEAWLRSRPLSP